MNSDTLYLNLSLGNPQKTKINFKKLATHTLHAEVYTGSQVVLLPFVILYSKCIWTSQAKLHDNVTMLVKKENRIFSPVI